jgi:hypothetical protein
MPEFLGPLLHRLHAAPASYSNQRPSSLHVDEIEPLLGFFGCPTTIVFLPVFTDVVICGCSRAKVPTSAATSNGLAIEGSLN